MSRELAQYQQTADQARQLLDQMTSVGVAFQDAHAMEQFAEKYQTHLADLSPGSGAGPDHRVWHFGKRPDRRRSGDYVKGDYEPATPGASIELKPGLYHDRQHLADQQKRADKLQELLASLDDQLRIMQDNQNQLARRGTSRRRPGVHLAADPRPGLSRR